MNLLMYKYRLYPSRKQKVKLINSFITCKTIYNDLLALSIDSWKFGKVSLSKFDCDKYLSHKKLGIHSQVIQNVSDRVHKSFANFFRRVKDPKVPKGEKGFPRFKSRVNSVTFPQSINSMGKRCAFWFNNKKLYVSKIGNIPIVLHRVPKGKIKTLTIKQNKVGQWFACFCCEINDKKIKHPNKKKIGIDVGIENLATLSNGEVINNERHLIKSEKKLKRFHRELSRKKKGSKNRLKAKHKLAVLYNKITNQRTDYLHKISNSLTKKHHTVVVEKLQIDNIKRNHKLAKSISDASWGEFIHMLSYKAVKCGGKLIEVDPKYTSKKCSKCGTIIDMPLSKRTFKCSCGYAAHRDKNAAINILKKSRAGHAQTKTPVEILPLLCRKTLASKIIEAGTIHDKNL